jgi:hypothetical protein
MLMMIIIGIVIGLILGLVTAIYGKSSVGANIIGIIAIIFVIVSMGSGAVFAGMAVGEILLGFFVANSIFGDGDSSK